MGLADLDQQLPPALRYSGQVNSDGSMPQRFTGYPDYAGYPRVGQLPPGFVQPTYGAFGNQPRPAPMPAPRFNLASLFSGGPGPGLMPSNNFASSTPSMFATTRSPAVKSALDSAFTNRNANAATEQQSLKDYAASVLSGQPRAQEFGDQEISAINQIYGHGGDSVESRIAQLNRQEQSAANIAAQRAASHVRRGINAMRAGGGSSSYLDRLLGQQLYGIGADTAGRAAQQGRADLSWLTGQRTGAVGRRQSVLDSVAQRGLLPAFAGQQLESGALGNLGHLANLDYGNNLYETPEDAWRRRLDFLDYIQPYFAA